jgi:putative transposase
MISNRQLVHSRWVIGRRWNTRIELANAIFDYLEIWHNRQRRHSSLGMLTPIQFENASTVA